MVNFNKKGAVGVCLSCLTLSSVSGFCALTQTVNIKVKILQATCIVNNNEEIEVNFGSDLISKNIDGNNYLKNISYTFSCSGSGSTDLKLRLTGNAASFNSYYLQTTMDDLGVAFFADNSPLKNGEWLNFKNNTLPILSAAPVKSDNAELVGGKFSASAVLQVEYQ
ncbi:fimbrial protein [Kluyvera ascorbata]